MLSFSFGYPMRGLFAAKGMGKIEYYMNKIEKLLYIHNDLPDGTTSYGPILDFIAFLGYFYK